jgi:hypothetical protein
MPFCHAQQESCHPVSCRSCHSVTTIFIIAILPLEVGAMVPFRPSDAMVVTSVTLFYHVADLFIVPLAKLMMHVASDALLDLAFALLHQ